MSEFELLRNITLGQYLPTGSYLHRMDPRAKIVATILVTGAVSFTPTLIGNAVLIAVCLLIVALGRIPLGYALRGLLPAIPVLVVLAVMQLAFFGRAYDPSSPVVFQWGWVTVTAAVVRLVIVSAARFVELLFVTSVFTLSTRTTELTHGIESLLRPFRRLRVPGHELALVVTIAIRFVPTLALEAERLMKAQASRGGRIGGSRWRVIERTRQLVPILVPLFTFALRRGEELIVAMEARAYTGGAGRTAYTALEGHLRDWLVPAGALAFFVVMLWARFPT
ncbi:MAG TPA: energy-coupling factor transporter transmembrane component T [bacterium]|nr:energy-coupling factor transporter transmembrane component T [bacterium]